MDPINWYPEPVPIGFSTPTISVPPSSAHFYPPPPPQFAHPSYPTYPPHPPLAPHPFPAAVVQDIFSQLASMQQTIADYGNSCKEAFHRSQDRLSQMSNRPTPPSPPRFTSSACATQSTHPLDTSDSAAIIHPSSPHPTNSHPNRPISLCHKQLRGFRHRVALEAKSRVVKKTRKPDLLYGVVKYSRSKMNRAHGLWAVNAHHDDACPEFMEDICQLFMGPETTTSTSNQPAANPSPSPLTPDFPAQQEVIFFVAVTEEVPKSIGDVTHDTSTDLALASVHELDRELVTLNVVPSVLEYDPSQISLESDQVHDSEVSTVHSGYSSFPTWPTFSSGATDNGSNLAVVVVSLKLKTVETYASIVEDFIPMEHNDYFDSGAATTVHQIARTKLHNAGLPRGFPEPSKGREIDLDRLWDDSGGLTMMHITLRNLCKSGLVHQACELILLEDQMLPVHGQSAIVPDSPHLFWVEGNFSLVTILNSILEATLLLPNTVASFGTLLVSMFGFSNHAIEHMIIAFANSIMRCIRLQFSSSSLKRYIEYEVHTTHLIEKMSINAQTLIVQMPIVTSALPCFGFIPSVFDVGKELIVSSVNHAWCFPILELGPPLTAFVSSFTSPPHVSVITGFLTTVLGPICGTIVVSSMTVPNRHFEVVVISCYPFDGEASGHYAWLDFLTSKVQGTDVIPLIQVIFAFPDNLTGVYRSAMIVWLILPAISLLNCTLELSSLSSSQYSSPSHGLVRLLFPLSILESIHVVRPTLLNIFTQDAYYNIENIVLLSIYELVSLQSKKHELTFRYDDVYKGNSLRFFSASIDLMPARLFPLQYARKLLLALVFGASFIPCQLVDFLRHCHCICRLPTLFWGQVLNFYGLILIKANMLMSDYGSDPIPLGAFLIILVCHFDMGWYITNSFSQMIYLTAYWLHMICSTKWYLQLLPSVMHHAIVWSGYGRLDYTSQRNSSSSYFHLNSEIHELLDPLPTAADDHSICDKIDVFYGTPKLTETFAALASQTDISFAWNSSASSIEPSIYRSAVLTRKAWLENQVGEACRQPFMNFAELEKWATLPIQVVNVCPYVIFNRGKRYFSVSREMTEILRARTLLLQCVFATSQPYTRGSQGDGATSKTPEDFHLILSSARCVVSKANIMFMKPVHMILQAAFIYLWRLFALLLSIAQNFQAQCTAVEFFVLKCTVLHLFESVVGITSLRTMMSPCSTLYVPLADYVRRRVNIRSLSATTTCFVELVRGLFITQALHQEQSVRHTLICIPPQTTQVQKTWLTQMGQGMLQALQPERSFVEFSCADFLFKA